MRKKERALFVEKKLAELYPNPKAPLDHSNAFTFLIAVLHLELSIMDLFFTKIFSRVWGRALKTFNN